MEIFWKTVAATILSMILAATIEKSEKDISLVITIFACCVVMTAAMQYLSEVIVFLWEIGKTEVHQIPFLETLLKISAVSLMTDLSGLISSDAGRNSLGKAVQFLGNTAILFLSLPVFESFLSIIREIMGQL